MRVRDVMTESVITTTPETPLKQAAARMAHEGVSGLPVVDEAGAVLGVVSEADIVAKEGRRQRPGGLLGWLLDPRDPWLEAHLEAKTVGDAMSSPPITIASDRPVSEAAARMTEQQVNRLPVVEGERLVGLVTRADLVRAFVRTDEDVRHEIEEEVLRKALWIDPERLRLRVEDGIVTLEGEVPTRADLELVPSFARRVPGVVDVESKLTSAEA